ncbi:MAG: hypothetical protein JNN07_06655 [Verrucomicrobiales bacterium]|nr:hypothetical protein [Verrucomicrobiales bacterium]
MNRSRLLLLLAVAALVAVLAYWLWPADDRALIKNQMKQLGRLASYSAEEHPISKQRAIGQMKALFSPDLVVQVNMQRGRSQSIEGRSDFMELVQQVRFGVPAIQLDFDVTSVELPPDHRSAVVLMTLSAKIGLEQQQEYQEMKAILENTSDGWLIKRLETVKTYGR